MTKLHAVIFDLDGTLVDSAPDIAAAINATMADFNRRVLTVEEVKKMVGDGIRVTLQRAMAATGGTADDVNLWMAAFTRHYYALMPDSGQVYPHVIDTLKTLRAAQIDLAICTNKQEQATLRLLDQLGLAPLFRVVAGVDTFAVHKPDPGHVQGVLNRLGLLPENCVMVGDSPNDVLAARGAGVKSIVVLHGYGARMESYGAEAMISGFDELMAGIGKLGFEVCA